MKLTKSESSTIIKAFEKLAKEKNIEVFPREMKIGDTDVDIDFPRDHGVVIPVMDMMKYIKEFESLDISTKVVRTNLFTQFPVFSPLDSIEFKIQETLFSLEAPDKYRIRFVSNPLLIGIAATVLDYWDKYWPPCRYVYRFGN